MLVGLVICVPLAAAEGIPARLHGIAWVWLALAGGGNVAGLMLTYSALRQGQVALVLPLVSTEGAIAALIAVVAGESSSSAAAAALLLATVGVCLASLRPTSRTRPARRGEHHFKVVALALCAALLFGGSLYGTARAAAELPSAWVVLSARVVGSVVLALPLMLSGSCGYPGPRSHSSSPQGSAKGARLLLLHARLGPQHRDHRGPGIAVLDARRDRQRPVVPERLGRLQLAGVCTVIVGVSVLSVATAS